MFNSEKELLVILDAMANVIDKIENLPEDCPAVKESDIFKKIQDEIKTLVVYMNNRVIEINKKIDNNNLQKSLRAMSSKKNEYN